MTKYAVILTGAVDQAEKKMLKKQGGQTALEALMDFIKEKFHEIRTVAIEHGKVIVEMADEAIQTFSEQLSNLLHHNFHCEVNARCELCTD